MMKKKTFWSFLEYLLKESPEFIQDFKWAVTAAIILIIPFLPALVLPVEYLIIIFMVWGLSIILSLEYWAWKNDVEVIE